MVELKPPLYGKATPLATMQGGGVERGLEKKCEAKSCGEFAQEYRAAKEIAVHAVHAGGSGPAVDE